MLVGSDRDRGTSIVPKAPKAKIEILITMEYELPAWDKDRHELYHQTDPDACVDIDVMNMQRELDDLLDIKGRSFLEFPTGAPEEVKWASQVSCEQVTWE
jgi:hypothetical protein